VGDEIEKMREELQQTVQHAHNKGKSVANGDVLPDPDAFEDEDSYAAFEQERQMEMMHEQDEALDGVFQTVGNLRQQADDMGRELEEQGELLEDVDNVADRVGGKLQTGLKKVGWVIKKNEGTRGSAAILRILLTVESADRWSSCCIAVLIFVLILLLVLLLIL
jgi:t-SNARE syntaxin family protein